MRKAKVLRVNEKYVGVKQTVCANTKFLGGLQMFYVRALKFCELMQIVLEEQTFCKRMQKF